MRRFEFVEGASSKFWQIELSKTSFTVQYGRIGTAGQAQTKSYDSEEKASKEHDKLVAEKLKKGYVEIGELAANLVAAATPSTASTPEVKPTARPAAAESPAAAEAPATFALEAEAPVAELPSEASEDRVFWSESLAKRVFPRRGGISAPLPNLPPAKKSWPKVQKAWNVRSKHFDGAIKKNSPAAAALQQLSARIAADAPASASVAEDAQLLAALALSPDWQV